MSHNLALINSVAPNREGEIAALSINDLTDVSAGSPSANNMLTWSGSAWSLSSDSISPQSARGYGGNTTSESGTLHTFPNPNLSNTDINRMFWEYAATQINYNSWMSSSTTNDLSFRTNGYAGGKTQWTCGFTFANSGVYAMRATLHIGGLSSSTAYIDCVWADSSYQFLGPVTRFSKSSNKRNTLRGVINANSGDVAGLYVPDYSGARYNRASYYNIFIEVERIQ